MRNDLRGSMYSILEERRTPGGWVERSSTFPCFKRAAQEAAARYRSPDYRNVHVHDSVGDLVTTGAEQALLQSVRANDVNPAAQNAVYWENVAQRERDLADSFPQLHAAGVV